MFPQSEDRKRIRSQEDELALPSRKRQRKPAPQSHTEDTSGENAAVSDCVKRISSLEYWTREFCWPTEYFKPEKNMNPPIVPKKSSSRGKQWAAGYVIPRSNASSYESTPSDQKPRGVKSAPYQSAQYTILLETKGSFMYESDLRVTDASKAFCRAACEAEQTIPEDSLFRDDVFDETCEMMVGRNEPKVIQDISRLIVPSAQSLAIRGAKHLKILIESVNEGWNSSMALTTPRPQPDYSVGFKRTAFNEDQLQKLQPFLAGYLETSLFMSTYYMYFPFLTCEVKGSSSELDIADRQNAHSATIAVRGVVELFRLVKREKELNREILAFSISHDARFVRLYGHYPVINGNKTTFYRHQIYELSIMAFDGKEKWTPYKFTKNVYDKWMPTHFKRICSVIDDLPLNPDFGVSEPGESELSQGLEPHHLSNQSRSDAASSLEADNSRDVTPDTALSQRIGGGTVERPKKRARREELNQPKDDN
ncbi:Hypothetical protein R9X50_00424500 [Acrodontium crateriforme]|uniref:DUF7924 domain-containing protein n=1 Tax=Acrodontium crateriforme TaxID=150365 RepID=A0AAQ3M5T5_9PEZI|nr:Hypothetical protein R9X50_00424500 [Acrodontium crateriforme]